MKTRFTTRRTLTPLLLITAALTCGCAGTTTFTSYPSKINPIIGDMQKKAPIDVATTLTDECTSADRILYNMERGRVAQISGNLPASKTDFSAAMETIQQNDQKALISASGVGAAAASILTNDNAIPYEGEGYERIMLHHYQAMNFLKLNDLEAAGVEIRRANSEQSDALKRFEGDIEKAKKDQEENQVDLNSMSPARTEYAQMDEVAGKVKNSFQNAYTFYLSGLVYELNSQPNDAYIDYKKALEIYPENAFIRKDLVRLAAALNMREDLDAYRERFNLTPADLKDAAAGSELVILYEDGFAPQKKEVKIPLPIPKVGLVAIAFPIYKEKWSAQIPLTVKEGSDLIGATEPLCDIRALAVKALQEKVPGMATRQLLRAAAKGAASAAASKHLGFAGQLAASVYNYASENADLRSWLTLPSNAQIMRVAMKSGSHKLSLTPADNSAATTVDVTVPESGKTILHVVRTGGQYYVTSSEFKQPVRLSRQ